MIETLICDILMLPVKKGHYCSLGLQPNGVLKCCNNIKELGIGRLMNLYLVENSVPEPTEWYLNNKNTIKRRAAVGAFTENGVKRLLASSRLDLLQCPKI